MATSPSPPVWEESTAVGTGHDDVHIVADLFGVYKQLARQSFFHAFRSPIVKNFGSMGVCV